MVVLPEAMAKLPYALLRAKRLRALAEECRSLAPYLQLRPDRERVLQMAKHRDAEAAWLEAKAALET
jgi:hypothetical protein